MSGRSGQGRIAKTLHEMVGTIAGLGALCVIVIIFQLLGTYRRGCTERKVIQTVGGCDLFGYCGVLFEDGTQRSLNKPVQGTSVCAQRGWVKSQSFTPLKNILASLGLDQETNSLPTERVVNGVQYLLQANGKYVRAIDIKDERTINGVLYKKVPGGWQKVKVMTHSVDTKGAP